MTLKCDFIFGLKKYVPGITHQLCTVAYWNPQVSKEFLLNMRHSPQKQKNQNISVV